MAVPERVRRGARMLCSVLVAQGIVGYTQYFTHLPPALVEVHVLGATALVVGAVQFHLTLTDHRRETPVPAHAPEVASPVELEHPKVEVAG